MLPQTLPMTQVYTIRELSPIAIDIYMIAAIDRFDYPNEIRCQVPSFINCSTVLFTNNLANKTAARFNILVTPSIEDLLY